MLLETVPVAMLQFMQQLHRIMALEMMPMLTHSWLLWPCMQLCRLIINRMESGDVLALWSVMVHGSLSYAKMHDLSCCSENLVLLGCMKCAVATIHVC